MKKMALMAASLATSMVAALESRIAGQKNRIFGFDNIQRHLRSQPRNHIRGNSIAKLNRHTGSPHEHKREIARHLRQTARKDS